MTKIKYKNNRINKEITQNGSNLGFKNGMLGKFVRMKQANARKGKGKTKIKETNNIMFSKKALMDKKQRKNGVLKGKTKGKPAKKTK